MHRRSRTAIIAGIAFPATLSLATLIALIALMPQAPAEIVMQWSFSGPASRYASPAELLFMPAIAVAMSAIIWSSLSSGTVTQARLGLSIGNGVAAALNGSALTLLLTQLAAPVADALPLPALIATVVGAMVVGLVTFVATRGAHTK